MVAAENDALPKAKVGGVADVVRDCPIALAKEGITVDVVIPDYGATELLRGESTSLYVPFAGNREKITLTRVVSKQLGVTQWVVTHPLFSEHQGDVYCNDDDGRPFATDATKFALFNASVCEALLVNALTKPDVIHLHDWHSACVAVLLKFNLRFLDFKQTHLVYTVHNIALQGIRPFKNDTSSFEAWFDSLNYDGQQLCDPRYPHCFNPMRSAINLADKVHLVSETYATEVLLSSEPQRGFFGGEGLEVDLQQAASINKVVGILNGCEYPEDQPQSKPCLSELYQAIESSLFSWMAKSEQLHSSYYIAHQRLRSFITHPNTGALVTSVGRLTDQKVLLLCQPHEGQLVIDALCRELSVKQGRLIMLGSGDTKLEQVMSEAMARNPNLLFLKGYGHKVGELLYQLGDLFLMPSSFEPCGISQMLAMREGQPCVVHQVGGLKDTVTHLANGFSFNGDSLTAQSHALISCFSQALTIRQNNGQQWQGIVTNAKKARFTWHKSAKEYISKLY